MWPLARSDYCSADASLEGVILPEGLGDRCAGTGADAAGFRGGIRGLTGAVEAEITGDSSIRVADAKVIDHRAGDDGDDAAGCLESDALHLKVAHDALCDVHAKGAAAGEEDGMDALDKGAGAEEVGLTSAGGRAANLDATNRAVVGKEEDGRARHGVPVRDVRETDARNGRDGPVLVHQTLRASQERIRAMRAAPPPVQAARRVKENDTAKSRVAGLIQRQLC